MFNATNTNETTHQGCKYQRLLDAAEANDFEELKLMYHAGYKFEEDIDEGCIVYAIERDDLENVKWLIKHGCPCDEEAAISAADKGYLHIIKFLHKKNQPIDSITPSTAAAGGYLDIIKYCVKNDIEWSDDVIINAATFNQFEVCKWINEEGYDDYTCEWTPEITALFAEHGNLEAIKYAYENEVEWIIKTCTNAASEGHIECLKYAHENGCPWDEDTTVEAASEGHLECLKYAHENDCPWSPRAITLAAAHGHLECLKYAHENGCPMSDQVPLEKAAAGGHLNTLRYTFENGCKWGDTSCVLLYTVKEQHNLIDPFKKQQFFECLKFAVENGCTNNYGGAASKAVCCNDIEKFKYLFDKCKDKQAFWKKYCLTKHETFFITKYTLNKIDLDDPVWRQLFALDLSDYPTLEAKVNNKKQEIQQMKENSEKNLKHILPLDIIKYDIQPFF
jgi:hypothetical protein